MFRNEAITGGRQVRNEDLTQYIQAFTLLEQMYSDLGYPDFILSGVEFTPNGSNFDISAGVIYRGSELCLFDGATNVALPHRLTKTSVGINPRLFFDSSTKNTATKLVMLADVAGAFLLGQTTPRQADLMPRYESNLMRAPLDTNGNGKGNIFRSMLSERSELMRVVPKPAGLNLYVKIGEFTKGLSQVHTLYFSGIANYKAGGIINFEYRSEASILAASVSVRYFDLPTNPPTFYTKDNTGTGKIELWVKSPSVTPTEGDFSTATFKLLSDSYSDAENRFEFNDVFSWSASIPTSIVTGSSYLLASDTDLTSLENEVRDSAIDFVVSGYTGNNTYTTVVTNYAKYKKVGDIVTVTASFTATFNSFGAAPSASTLSIQTSVLKPFGDDIRGTNSDPAIPNFTSFRSNVDRPLINAQYAGSTGVYSVYFLVIDGGVSDGDVISIAYQGSYIEQ